jgi:excisionase family DNA binding protein
MALLTVVDLEKDSNISRHTWRRWLKERRLPSILLGRRRRVDEADYRRFVKRGRIGASHE